LPKRVAWETVRYRRETYVQKVSAMFVYLTITRNLLLSGKENLIQGGKLWA
jgi:hypothetical protein